jgi:hypothetical protein
MSEFILAHQSTLRLCLFAGVFAAMLAWEALAPRRPRAAPRLLRWPGNVGVTILGAFVLRVAFPLTAVAWAAEMSARGIGLLNAVAFVDSGTVTESITLGQYRVAVGVGLRIYIEQLGPAPLAFDFAIPLKDVEGDQTQVFSFSAELPF